MTITIAERDGGFDLSYDGHMLVKHRPSAPFALIGRGEPQIRMYRGNFDLGDSIKELVALTHAIVREAGEGWEIELAADADSPALLRLDVPGAAGPRLRIGLHCSGPGFNRLWMDIAATPDERIWGGGEQMSYLNLRGRIFPLWTSEPGVGRDKSTALTRAMDEQGMAGGDYWTTNYPQPTWLSSRRYALHIDSTAYASFDFTAEERHRIEVWEIPAAIELFHGESLTALVGRLADRFGRQPQLPDWCIEGAIVGLKDGARSFERLERILDAGVPVTGLWCEDWAGIRETSFGRRLFWDWTWDRERYPSLDRDIERLAGRGIRFLGYVNPYLCNDGQLYREAEAAGLLALRQDRDEPYLVDFGEFDCGIVDFTNPDACAWFAERVVGQEMIDFGLAGWMADFGEYLPTDVRLSNGLDPTIAHNAWPVLWAKVNADAVAQRGRRGDITFFMRAGGAGVQAHCPLLWAGDQSVDFSRHDGIGTTICAALSAGLLGNAYSHSDIGGYTSLLGNLRTAELVIRWTEMAAFTPVMRTHEGNRPAENLQIDSTPELLAHFAALARVHAALAPYTRSLCEEAETRGLPAQRPLFLHYEEDAEAQGIEDQYLYGPDLLVAPVIEAGAITRRLYLPGGEPWVHLWSGAEHAPGWTELPAPIGLPPVFFRRGSSFAGLFRSIGRTRVPPLQGEGDRHGAAVGVEGHVPLDASSRRSAQPPVPLHHASPTGALARPAPPDGLSPAGHLARLRPPPPVGEEHNAREKSHG